MTSIYPRLLKAGIVLLDPASGALRRVIALQYNPDTLSRTLQVQGAGAESQNRSEALRLKGPAVETIKLDAEIDATDQLAAGDPTAAHNGIQPQLSALETMLYPTSQQLLANLARASAGTLEIAPMESPLALLVIGKARTIPVRITEFSVTEEAFDPNLNPIRAKVSIGMRVLSIDDLGFAHKGGNLFMSYLKRKESLAASSSGRLGALGLQSAP